MPTPTDDVVREGSAGTTRCRNCGAHVSPRFVRVFGNNEDELYHCLECSTFRDLQQGAGTDY